MMRKVILSAVLMFSLFLPRIALAEGDWCAPGKTPIINVHTSTDQVVYNFTLSKKQLDNFAVNTVNPYAAHIITDVGGLMKGGINAQQKMTFGTLTNPVTNEVCYWHDSMDIYLHIKPTVYIANDFPQGTCMHNAILEHENQHVSIDREIVNKYAAIIGDAIRNDITAYHTFGPVPISQQATLEAQIKLRMHKLLGHYTKQMSDERRQRQQAHDNINEYERVNNLCKR